MSALKLEKLEYVSLKKSAYDEKWLQNVIEKDPEILNLGNLRVMSREKKQSSGGRIDFLMCDDDSTMYEVEVMLGKLDESHIIRTIEYWDLEKRRYPSFDHIAVIVAEDITSRFFNVISLMNKAIPIIAIKLTAHTHGENLYLNFTKVLDISESPEFSDASELNQSVDRNYWIERSNPESFKVTDELIKFFSKNGLVSEVTYNNNHIAHSAPRANFCWSHPNLTKSNNIVDVRVGEENVSYFFEKLSKSGFNVRSKARYPDQVKFDLVPGRIKEFESLFLELFQTAYKNCS